MNESIEEVWSERLDELGGGSAAVRELVLQARDAARRYDIPSLDAALAPFDDLPTESAEDLLRLCAEANAASQAYIRALEDTLWSRSSERRSSECSSSCVHSTCC